MPCSDIRIRRHRQRAQLARVRGLRPRHPPIPNMPPPAYEDIEAGESDHLNAEAEVPGQPVFVSPSLPKTHTY